MFKFKHLKSVGCDEKITSESSDRRISGLRGGADVTLQDAAESSASCSAFSVDHSLTVYSNEYDLAQ